MKRIIQNIICIALFGVIAIACTDEKAVGGISNSKETVVTLYLSNKSLKTRATGNSASNENLINYVDCFFYPAGAADTEDAIYSVSRQYVGKTESATLSITIPQADIDNLFGSGNTCKIYVVANHPTHTYTGNSIKALKSSEISADFKEEQTSFVMDGEGTVTLNGNELSGTIELSRAASKISLIITKVEQSVKIDGETWTSDPSNMKVFFFNGVNKTHIDVSHADCQYTPQASDYFEFPLNKRGYEFTEDTTEPGKYEHAPFYSYSSQWEANTKKEHEAYLILVLPWKKGTSRLQSCYYYIPVSTLDYQLARNHYYKIYLSVSTLGSFTPEEAVKLTSKYIILDWGTEKVPVGIKDYRYLVVDKNSVVMNNVNSIDVGYLSSHPVTTEIVSITKPNYSKNNESTDKVSSSGFEFSTNEQKSVLTLTHTLKNDNTTKDYDYVPYTIKVKVYHTDLSEICEEIEYVQYPALYIKADKNPQNNKWGDVYINGNQSPSSNWDEVNGILNSDNNSNPNMYIISVSAFSGNSKYIIADPRSITSVQMEFNKDEYGKELTNYYPTLEGKNYENYIAPKFRICSAYGRLSGRVKLTKEKAEYRCASYQEAGYPAGRWRLPTSAELQFIGKICAEKKIPPLFYNNQTYWCASGGYKYSNGNFTSTNNGNANYVRCVYDEWYWNDTVDKGTFTWGDKPRN